MYTIKLVLATFVFNVEKLKEKENWCKNHEKQKQLKDKGSAVGVALIADLSVLAGVCRLLFSFKKNYVKKSAEYKISADTD